jgi:hypothetical protein
MSTIDQGNKQLTEATEPRNVKPVAATPVVSISDLATQLERLTQMRDRGIVAEDEFQRLKLKLLRISG